MSAQEQNVDATSLSQPNFESTPYEDADYEVIGESRDEPIFEPLELSCLAGETTVVDVMFADFGGRVEGESTRWHLPEGVGYVSAKSKEEQEDAERREQERVNGLIEAARAEAFERGKMEAYEEAVTSNAAKLLELQERSVTLFKDLQEQMREHLAAIEREAVKLAVAISEKLVGTAVEVNPEYLVRLVNDAIKLSGTAQIKKVRLSPPDMEFVEVVGITKHLAEFDGTWGFEADPSIRSGCVMETSAGEIDLRIDEAWERIKDGVVKVAR